LEAELRGLSDELADFKDERTALRDALWWADMTTTPDGGGTTVAERVAEIQTRYGTDNLVSCFIRRHGMASTQPWNVRSIGSKPLASLRHRTARCGARRRDRV
jgi:hypothetical protein